MTAFLVSSNSITHVHFSLYTCIYYVYDKDCIFSSKDKKILIMYSIQNHNNYIIELYTGNLSFDYFSLKFYRTFFSLKLFKWLMNFYQFLNSLQAYVITRMTLNLTCMFQIHQRKAFCINETLIPY